MNKFTNTIIALGATLISTSTFAAVINPTEDVMTSGFFQGANKVRGYTSDSRNVHRVSTPTPFSTPAAETVYIQFDQTDFTAYTSPVANAILTVQSANGGFNNDASAASPFTVSAHAVNADPIADITDDTNPAGTIAWSDFYANNIVASTQEAQTVVDSFGAIDFDITAIVNQWIAGTNTNYYIALTGKDNTSGNQFLHGFNNNTENPGSTYITIPEPTSLALLTLTSIALIKRRK